MNYFKPVNRNVLIVKPKEHGCCTCL